MVELNISGVHFELDEGIKDYVEKKIGVMDKYVPRNERGASRGEVVLSEEEGKSKNRYTCDVTLYMPHETITAQESTVSIYAAVDIVEEKLKTQLLKHKDKRQNDRQRRRSIRMLKQFKGRR